jgi:hypothetical protein
MQSFDGETLEAALARVTEECGPGARIAQAEKVRTGGIAGFFARERYEVTVEVEDGAPVPVARPADEPATGAAEASEPPSAAPRSLLDLVDEASAQEREAVEPSGAAAWSPPSTEGPTFQEVLRGIAAQAGLLDAPEPADEHMTDPTPTPVPTPAPETTPMAEDGPTRMPAVEADVVPGPVVVRPTWEVVVREDTEADADVFPSLGIPERLLAATDGQASVAQRLLAVLERLPEAPPVLARRGDVVLVVGDAAVVHEAAAVVAKQLGQDDDDIVVAGPHARGFHTLSDPSTAADRASMWRRCGAPFVVALDAPAGPRGAEWVREMREALQPVAVWGAVPAERKPEDVAAWATAIGGVDALAVGGCDATATPAAVVAAGIPVAALEGRRASAAAWTAVLMERLSV